MSALAALCLARKIPVSGSDQARSLITEKLEREGASIFEGHVATQVPSGATVVYSSDIATTNPEWKAAQQLENPMLHRSSCLALLAKGYKALAVTGTHGKTTTSSLLASLLTHAGRDPSYAVGGLLKETGSNSRHGTSDLFVLEADESDGSFLAYEPHLAIITNIDLDHMNHFKTEENLIEAFRQFSTKARQVVWWGDDTRLCRLGLKGISFGFGINNDYRASNTTQEGWNLYFDVHHGEKFFSRVSLPLIGAHNVLNGLAVFAAAHQLGLSEKEIREGLAAFQGVRRRADIQGEEQAILVVDDYAHHPTEVLTTLRGLRQAVGPRRLVAIFQPHRVSRTADCLGQYGPIFQDADEVWITDLYTSGEAPREGVTGEKVYEEVQQKKRFVPYAHLIPELVKNLRPHDVVVTLGAGDITKIGKKLGEALKQSPPQLKVGLVCGGLSAEHEISVISARHLWPHLRSDLYETTLFTISPNGKWRYGKEEENVLEKTTHRFSPQEGDILSADVLAKLQACEIVLPILHGPFGEDGRLQGFFDILGIPYVGCDHQSATICMDKAVLKKLAVFHGIQTAPFVDFNQEEWKEGKGKEAILKALTFPLYVKPVHLGSSVGVTRVESAETLETALALVFRYDTHVVVEEAILGREIEFALLGNENPYAFPPAEIPSAGSAYDYEKKYGTQALEVVLDPELPVGRMEEGRQLAIRAYQIAGCKGMARVDFFLDEEGTFWLNEINPIPGLRPKSLYPMVCEHHGLSISSLLDQLICLGLHKTRVKAALTI